MKFRPIPLTQRLTQLHEERGLKAMLEAREGLVADLFRHEGFQVLAEMLRSLEHSAHRELAVCLEPGRAQRLLGGLNMLENIRSSLIALLPAGSETLSTEFHDEATEDYLGPIMEDAGA